MLSQNIAMANVISDGSNIITFVKNCAPKTNGGEYEQFLSGGESAKGIWVAGGARLIDQAAYRICLHGILNNGGKI
jgi:cystathionine beta-lyase family protein involved in aluminum resistance